MRSVHGMAIRGAGLRETLFKRLSGPTAVGQLHGCRSGSRQSTLAERNTSLFFYKYATCCHNNKQSDFSNIKKPRAHHGDDVIAVTATTQFEVASGRKAFFDTIR